SPQPHTSDTAALPPCYRIDPQRTSRSPAPHDSNIPALLLLRRCRALQSLPQAPALLFHPARKPVCSSTACRSAHASSLPHSIPPASRRRSHRQNTPPAHTHSAAGLTGVSSSTDATAQPSWPLRTPAPNASSSVAHRSHHLQQSSPLTSTALSGIS